MEPWVASLLAIVVGVAGGWVGAHIGARVALAKLEVRMGMLEQEVTKLRAAKHDHAQFITRHELDIENMKRRMK